MYRKNPKATFRAGIEALRNGGYKSLSVRSNNVDKIYLVPLGDIPWKRLYFVDGVGITDHPGDANKTLPLEMRNYGNWKKCYNMNELARVK